MSRHGDCLVFFVVHDLHVTLVRIWADKNCAILIGAEGTKAFGIRGRVNCINELQIDKVVDIYSVLEHNDYSNN